MFERSNLSSVIILLDDGYPASAIWRELQRCGAFDAKYAQFMIYVKNYVVAKKKPTEPLSLGVGTQQGRVKGASALDFSDTDLINKQQSSLLQKGMEKRTMSFMDMNIDGVGELLEPYTGEEDFENALQRYKSIRS